jgi:pyruvate/2-oxoglutarate/acetoin dehydrogenase E1 component
MGKYQQELTRAMAYLAADPRTIFLGQAVGFPGTAMSGTLVNVSKDKLTEFPVAEELQMGASIGLALGGFVPVTIFPRWNFLLLAVNQLVGHLDKLSAMSQGGYQPKVIIRTGIGSERPLHPSHQHVNDYTDAFKLMLTTVEVIRLDEPEDVFPAYEKALTRTDGCATMCVEFGDYYSEK